LAARVTLWVTDAKNNFINRGINSDTTAGVLNRVDEVVALKPKRVYLIIGVNDVVKGLDLNHSAEDIMSTIRILKEHNIDTVRFSTLPIAGGFASHNERISVRQ
jgi:lysophospholipase L1-like esterase